MRIFQLALFGLVFAAAGPGIRAGEAPATKAAQDWRVAVKEFALKHFKNPAWGYSHCERDYALARELAAIDKVTLDDDVLFAAAYLHDMAAFAPWEKPDEDHADVAARVVYTVLK